MKITHSRSELLQQIESNIDSALQNLEHMQTGNFAHRRGTAVCVLSGCKNTWIKKLKRLLEDEEK